MPYLDAAELARRYLLVPRSPQRRRPPTPTRADKLEGLCKRFRVPLADVLAIVKQAETKDGADA
jgi:hypothetical protein